MNFIFVTTANGYQLEKCLRFDFFRKALHSIVSNSDCRAISIASAYGIKSKIIKDNFNTEFNDYLKKNKIDFVLSQNNRIIFNMDILDSYKNKIFNLHNSILPSFKGTKEGYNSKSRHSVSQIFERQIDFGSLIMGVTIHIIENDIDSGKPIIVSVMNRPYGENTRLLRHKMFVQEVKIMLQLVKWLIDNRYTIEKNDPIIKNAQFDTLEYVPNLDEEEIINYNLEAE